MPNDAAAAWINLHGTAVAIAGRALLILGASGSGKSRLALALLERSAPDLPIRLVGDDRILLKRRGRSLAARGHPRIQGFIERRGLGIVAAPHVAEVPVRAVVQIGPASLLPQILHDYPRLHIAVPGEGDCKTVLTWWRDPSTTLGVKASAGT